LDKEIRANCADEVITVNESLKEPNLDGKKLLIPLKYADFISIMMIFLFYKLIYDFSFDFI
jgi:hypothetical protein